MQSELDVVPSSSGCTCVDQWAGAVPQGWVTDQTETQEQVVRLCKLQNMLIGFSNQPTRVHICLTVNTQDGTWGVYAQDRQLNPNCSALQGCPSVLAPETLCEQLLVLDSLTPCCGNPDQELMELATKRKGVFREARGKEVKARVETIPFATGGQAFATTIRTTGCEILTKKGRCEVCKAYQRTLLTMASKEVMKGKHDVTNPESHTNCRYLSTPEKVQRAKRRTTEVKHVCIHVHVH